MIRFFIFAPILKVAIFIFAVSNLNGKEVTGRIVGKIQFPSASKNQRIAIEKYTGSISGSVSPPKAPVAAVWLTAPGLSAPASPKPVVLNQKDYQFSESMLVIPKNTMVLFPNQDPDYHNVFSLSKAKRFDLGRYKKGERPTPKLTFDKLGLIRLRCEIHDHMRAHILVVDTPFYTRTKADGSFVLEKVPPGQYTLNVQLDKKNKWTQKISVSSGKILQLQL